MFNKIVNCFKNLDKLTKLIMNNGLKFCLFLGLISIAVLVTYNFSLTIPVLFRLSLIFGIEFVICGIVVDGIKKQLI